MAGERDESDAGRATTAGGEGIKGARGASGTDITGGTDKAGQGALANPDMPKTNEPRVEETVETGDILGASSTHAGAGGVLDNTGGTGTAPTGGTIFGDGGDS